MREYKTPEIQIVNIKSSSDIAAYGSLADRKKRFVGKGDIGGNNSGTMATIYKLMANTGSSPNTGGDPLQNG